MVAGIGIAGAEQNQKNKSPRRQAELTLRVVEASSIGTAPNDAADLVPQELKNLLRFSRYRLLDAAMIRGGEGETLRLAIAGELRARMQFEMREGGKLEYDLEIHAPSSGKGTDVLLETEAVGASGETLVLGASRMKDARSALIVLLTGRLLP